MLFRSQSVSPSAGQSVLQQGSQSFSRAVSLSVLQQGSQPLSLCREDSLSTSFFPDVLETFYRPTSFMRLSSTSCQPLFEELLLLLQPLGLLTFNLDLLFQHHHLEPANQSPDIPSPPNQDAGFRLSPRGAAANWSGRSYFESLSELDSGSVELEETNVRASSCSMADSLAGGLGELANGGVASVKVPVCVGKKSPQLLWVQEKEIRNIAPPSDGEASLSQQAGQVIASVLV